MGSHMNHEEIDEYDNALENAFIADTKDEYSRQIGSSVAGLQGEKLVTISQTNHLNS